MKITIFKIPIFKTLNTNANSITSKLTIYTCIRRKVQDFFQQKKQFKGKKATPEGHKQRRYVLFTFKNTRKILVDIYLALSHSNSSLIADNADLHKY